jgi:hypothetical protein
MYLPFINFFQTTGHTGLITLYNTDFLSVKLGDVSVILSTD